MNKKRTALFTVLLVLLAYTFLGSLLTGSLWVPPGRALAALMATGKEVEGTVKEGDRAVIRQIRLPRVILACVVGAGLAVCGAVFQGMLRNPLADPFTLGVSGGAALGATIGIVLGRGGLWVPALAFAGALGSVCAAYAIASRKGFSAMALILGGVVMSFICSSCVLFVFALSTSKDVHVAMLWIMGDLSSADPFLVKVAALCVGLGVIVLIAMGRELNVLTLGEEKATYLGLRTEQVKKLLFVIASFITGVCVAASGIIGFVGLMVPHLVRLMGGPDHRFLIPASALGGAILLTLCDSLARTIIAPIELPVGVITGILGGVFFLVFFLRRETRELF